MPDDRETVEIPPMTEAPAPRRMVVEGGNAPKEAGHTQRLARAMVSAFRENDDDEDGKSDVEIREEHRTRRHAMRLLTIVTVVLVLFLAGWLGVPLAFDVAGLVTGSTTEESP